jgi:ElaB/YqjD/DUF883 family membrane-anchored ribosome-binding protein
LFWIIRYAASISQFLQVSLLPRGARIWRRRVEARVARRGQREVFDGLVHGWLSDGRGGTRMAAKEESVILRPETDNRPTQRCRRAGESRQRRPLVRGRASCHDCTAGLSPLSHFEEPHMSTESSQKLTDDVKAVFSDAEAMVKATASEAGTKLAVVRDRLQQSLSTARERVSDMEKAVVAKSKAAAQSTDAYVHENPWPSLGAVAAIGVVIGILIGSSRR